MTCERYIWARGEDRLCRQRVGLIRWYDVTGKQHAACRNHVAVMQSLYPRKVDYYTTWTDAGWTEGELAEAFGR